MSTWLLAVIIWWAAAFAGVAVFVAACELSRRPRRRSGQLWTLDKPTGRPMTWRDPR
jgi:hypothetical protein